MKWGALVAVAAFACAFASPALADDWLPHNPDATWTYQWTDSEYNTVPTTEKVTVKSTKGTSFTLAWTTAGLGNSADAVSSTGTIALQETTSGIDVVSPYWSSNAPPSNFPFLCAAVGACPNSLSSTYYNVVWGSIAHVLQEPLLRGTTWSGTGGDSTIQATSTYAGTEKVTVPAFPSGVLAAKIRSDVAQAGALGDPYGSGVKTVWWVYGVGPVKVVFQHAGGTGAAVTTAVLHATNQTAQPPPFDASYFPMQAGLKGTYRWTNKRYFKKPEVESFTVDQAANDTAIVKVQSVSGPMKVAGAYQFTTRLDGVTSVASATKAASLAKLPPLGPSALPAGKRRHFFTPFDLMTFGFSPVLPAYPTAGTIWSSDPNSRDFAVYGVNGASRIVGVQTVKVPAGTFQALVVASKLTQPGFKFGSGTRTMWFAPNKGLVKLEFRHADGSVSVVELIK